MGEEKLYKKMYCELFNSVTKALEEIETSPNVAEIILKSAQLNCEQMYIEAKPALPIKLRKRHH